MENILIVQNSLSPKSQTASRAAQYVRMSTDHQRYSTANQQAVIATYAAERNVDVVRTYVDAGRSGLTIAGREGLQQLIADVQFGRANFDCIFVYDVSRWGRFQDADESAYYEFVCKRAGINVHYCADEFENDGSLSSTIPKVVKRAAAADFSRQLSKKVFIGQCRITELGFWHGGAPAFGLRRELLSESGHSRGSLETGQRKALQTDRIILKPGPASERRIVRRIFRMLVSERKGFKEIATELNADQVATARGNPWAGQTILKVLTNEAYIGNIVFNRMSYKLQQKAIKNPPDMWIRREHALPPIIPPAIFAKAQEIIADRRQAVTDQEVLDRLAALRSRKGHLSSKLISKAPGLLNPTTLITRFGSLTAAYKQIGFQPAPRYRWLEIETRMRFLIETAVADLITELSGKGIQATFEPQGRVLSLDGSAVTVTIGAARSLCEGHAGKRWRVKTDRSATTDWTLIFRMDETNTDLRDYYMLPTSEIARSRVKKLRMTSRVFTNSSRLETLEDVADALEATHGHPER